MTIGDTTPPSKIPNLNQILFKGFRVDEFNKPKIKKIIEGIIAQILILPPLNSIKRKVLIFIILVCKEKLKLYYLSKFI
mgnify:CR=1 FL=1